MFEMMGPGLMALTRISYFASSSARVFISPITPHLEAQYAPTEGLAKMDTLSERLLTITATAGDRIESEWLGPLRDFEREISGVERQLVDSSGGRMQDMATPQEVMQVLAEMRLSADIIHVRDIKEIGKYGVMGMPALIINGEVKSVGRIPPKFKLLEWLTDAKKSI